MPYELRGSLKPTWQKYCYCLSCQIPLFGICYCFWKFGFFPGISTAVCFVMAFRISHLFLRQRIHGLFHLNMVLKGLERNRLKLLRSRNIIGARWLEGLIDKVTRELYAIKVIKSAELVPSYEGSTLYLSIHGAKADNYHCSHEGNSQRQ
jgi:hypothetical protein